MNWGRNLMKPTSKSTISQAALENPFGQDPMEQKLQSLGLPLARKNLLNLAYTFGLPDVWDQELENDLPLQIRRDLSTSVNEPGSGADGQACADVNADRLGLAP
jgi:hypothetical protein